MYQIVAHDGVRFVKLVLLFANQASFLSSIFESNKFTVAKGSYLSKADSSFTFLIDKATEIQELWNDKRGVKI
jgi:hypothetical protein